MHRQPRQAHNYHKLEPSDDVNQIGSIFEWKFTQKHVQPLNNTPQEKNTSL